MKKTLAQLIGKCHERHAGAEEQHRHISAAQEFTPDDLPRRERGCIEQVGIRLLPFHGDADAGVERDEQDAGDSQDANKHLKHAPAQLLIHAFIQALADEKDNGRDEQYDQKKEQDARHRPTADGLAQFLDHDRIDLPLAPVREVRFDFANAHAHIRRKMTNDE